MLCAAEPGTPAPPQPWRGARPHSAPSFPAAHFSAEIFSLAAHSRTDGAPVNPEKPHQGVASKKTAPHQPDIARNSTTALGLSWSWWSGTAPGARVTYDYDAWGNTVNTAGSTPNVYLYRGEQYDPDLGLYYLRARLYSAVEGRIVTRDPWAGAVTNPVTLHKYLYASGDPVGHGDPSGMATIPMPWPQPQPRRIGGSEYVLLALAFALNPAINNAMCRAGEEIKCIWQETDSALEAAAMIAVISAFDWVTPNRPPGGIGDKGPPLPPNMPPPDDPGPSGESCGQCNCAIQCTIRQQSGSGQGGYSATGYRWAFGRGKNRDLCVKNAIDTFNSSQPGGAGSGQTAGLCNKSKVIFGKYCRN
jgi:RHS repeat-associated protein